MTEAEKFERWTEESTVAEDEGAQVGRDPRTLTVSDWGDLERLTGMQAIRAKCLDCVYTYAEVRKCTVVSCPLWPYRQGSVPKALRAAEAERGKNRDDESGTQLSF